MKTTKHEMEKALKDLKAIALKESQDRSLAHMKTFGGAFPTLAETAYFAGSINGIALFLKSVEDNLDRLYRIEASGEE